MVNTTAEFAERAIDAWPPRRYMHTAPPRRTLVTLGDPYQAISIPGATEGRFLDRCDLEDLQTAPGVLDEAHVVSTEGLSDDGALHAAVIAVVLCVVAFGAAWWAGL